MLHLFFISMWQIKKNYVMQFHLQFDALHSCMHASAGVNETTISKVFLGFYFICLSLLAKFGFTANQSYMCIVHTHTDSHVPSMLQSQQASYFDYYCICHDLLSCEFSSCRCCWNGLCFHISFHVLLYLFLLHLFHVIRALCLLLSWPRAITLN